MKKATLLLLAIVASKAVAQDVKASDVSPATKRYHEYRQAATEPTYGLAKVKALLKATSATKGDEMDSKVLPSAAWNRLTTPERFTYCMLHGEVSSQNCDAMPWIVDEEHKVFAYPPSFHDGEESWSDRQRAFLSGHRSAVIGLLRSTIREKRRVGVNLKAAIVEIHANELIPDLVSAYDRDRKDNDLLSVLMLLMKDGKDKPFLASITYRKLYGPKASYQAFIVANDANQKLMVQRAMAFYHRRVG